MQNLPTAEVYEKEFSFMPWGMLVDEVLKEVGEKAPRGGKVLDFMCGPGYLLGKLQQRRPDLLLTGVDLEPEFITYANKMYQDIEFITGDALIWEPEEKYDVVLCTAGLHHLPYDKQEIFLKKLKSLVNSSGFVIVADPYIDDYETENDRKVAAAKLGYEYLVATIRNGAAEDVIVSAVGILQNDVMGIEYKNSIKKSLPLFQRAFSSVRIEKTWPTFKSEYGDYIFYLKH